MAYLHHYQVFLKRIVQNSPRLSNHKKTSTSFESHIKLAKGNFAIHLIQQWHLIAESAELLYYKLRRHTICRCLNHEQRPFVQ